MNPSPSQKLRDIASFPKLIAYLADELDWPIDANDFESYSFDWDAAEDLGVAPEHAAKIKQIKQLRPLVSGQPWGVFFIEFEPKKLPVGVLRRLLNKLVTKQRASANAPDRQTWDLNDLLFISSFVETRNEREIAFAHFHQDAGDLPTLRVLGWDGGDTPLKLDHVDRELRARLRWPDDENDPDAWRKTWSGAFRHRLGHTIQTADLLAKALAELAKGIRDRCQTLIAAESDRGPLTKLHKAFQAALIHDLTEEGFADTYAQTITYGLLTAAISRTDMESGADGTFVQADNITDMVPVTNPFLKEMLQSFLHAGGRKGGLDFDELGVQDVVELLRGDETDLPAILRDFGNKNPNEDPVIRFYEDFLTAYNKKLKVQRGVFYTPQPVVSYIVRSVHELLQTDFGLDDGLASTVTWGDFLNRQSAIGNRQLTLPPLTDEPGEKRTIDPNEFFVQILDPATGTGTFLVETIDVIHKHLSNKWKTGGAKAMPTVLGFKFPVSSFESWWNGYVPAALLPRLYAYELMMAPYAIAHMKIGLKLHETGYRFGSDERVRVFLTNALEPWQRQLTLPDVEALAHEAAAVNEIKRHKRFTVVIGNPPYSGISSNRSDEMLRIVDAYRIVDGAALTERKLWLQDDYVKFIRKAQTTIETTRVGVLGYITNHGYLDNPTFRGMRQSLMGTFPRLSVLDLHGNAKKTPFAPDGSPDANVFDIQQGVSLALFSTLCSRPTSEQTSHSELWGSRESKYHFLDTNSSKSTKWNELHPAPEFYLLVPHDIESKDEYEEGWKVTDIFPVNGTGVVTGRDSMTIDFDREQLWSRVTDFAKLSDAAARADYELGKDARDWRVATAQADVRASGPTKSKLVPILYRPFDYRFTYYTGHSRGFYASPCAKVMQNMAGGQNMGFVWTRPMSPQFEFTVCVSRTVADQCSVGNKSAGAGISYLAPLRVSRGDVHEQGSLGLDGTTQPNLSGPFLKQLGSRLNLSRTGLEGLPVGLTPEDIFHYAYAVFHSPGYRSRYAEFLKIDFPRLPLTGNLEMFRALARLGGELVSLHLLESPKLAQPITEFIGGRHPEVEKISWSQNTVWIDKAQTTGFQGVRDDAWNFHIGGYQVCEKWLKDRKGRILTDDDIAHYRKIVVALANTIRLMAEIDDVIETHGGWPGAFHTEPISVVEPIEPAAKGGQAELFNPAASTIAHDDAAEEMEASDEEEEEKPDEDAGYPVWIEDPASDMIAIRRAIHAAGANGMDREALLHNLVHVYGWNRLGPALRAECEKSLSTAARRGILYTEKGHCFPDCRMINDYEKDDLKEFFLAAIGRGWIEREDAYVRFARHLGFLRNGPNILEAAKSIINGLIRQRRLENDGTRIRRIPNRAEESYDEYVPKGIEFTPLKTLEGRGIAVTGYLGECTHEQAGKRIKRAGGIYKAHVSSTTDILVIGNLNPLYKQDSAGNKIIKAQELNESGEHSVRFMRLSNFLRMIGI